MGDRRPGRAVWLVTALVLVGVAGLVSSARAARSETTRTVTYRGYKVEVPVSWPVVDLSRDPSACVRFDVHAVYLGHPGSAQSCPAKLVGRTESLLVEPLDQASRARVTAATVSVPPGTAAARAVPARESHEVTFAVSAAGVLVTASYGGDRAAMSDVLASATLTSDAQPTTEQAPSASTSGLVSASLIAPGTFTGKGFDACTAPSSTAMQAWLSSSPYRAVGVYVGGINRACAQPNLTASWLSTQVSLGWHPIPTYVGLQAPCSGVGRMIDPATAASQGRAAADDAVVNAGSLGIGGGSVLYFDMEAYTADTACRDAVLTFLSNWTTRLHELSYLSGVYSSASSGIRDLVSVYDSTVLARPDHIWFARWDGVATVSDTVIPSTDWPNHQRIKQYQGGHNETYGGVTINIDNDYLDVTSGAAPPPPPPDGDQDSPAAVTLGTEMHVFARGTDQRLYETFFRPGSGWSSWASRGALTIAGSPVAVLYGTGINVYARGTDGRLYETFFRPGSGWSTWRAHAGAALAGDPAAVRYGTGINVYARGTDGQLYEIFFRSGSGWSTWRAHAGATLAGDPAAMTLGTELHVFARGADSGLYETFFRSGFGWSAWLPHAGAALAGDPAAVAYGTGINVYARGTDQRLYEIFFRPDPGWSTWRGHSGAALAGNPAVVVYGTEIHVFARGTDDTVRETYFRTGSGWSSWLQHGSLVVAGTPAVALYNTDIHLFARGKDNHLYETYFRPSQGWSAWTRKGGTAVSIA